MSGSGQQPDSRLVTLYRTWSQGGSRLLITGNVMVHDAAMTGPGGAVLDKDSPIEPLDPADDSAIRGYGLTREGSWF